MLFQSVFFHSRPSWITTKGKCGDGKPANFSTSIKYPPLSLSNGGDIPQAIFHSMNKCIWALYVLAEILTLHCSLMLCLSNLAYSPSPSLVLSLLSDLKALSVCSCSVLFIRLGVSPTTTLLHVWCPLICYHKIQSDPFKKYFIIQ